MSNGNDTAFPIVHPDGSGVQYFGLGKREYFAAMALQGILANSMYESPRREKLGLMAKDAVSAADALLDALTK